MVKIRRSEKVRITQASDLISGKSVWLATSRDFHDADGDFGGEAGSDHRTGPTTRVVAIEHQRNLPEVLLEECLLPLGKGTSHQGNDTWQPSLMDLQTVEEPLHEDNCRAVANGAVQIEEHEGLPKTGWKAVLRLALAQGSSSVRHQHSILVVNWDNDPTFHAAFPRIKADAEVASGQVVHTTLGKVGVAEVNSPESKGQWPIAVSRGGRCGRAGPFGRSKDLFSLGIRGCDGKPVAEPERGITDRAALHRRYEIEHIAAAAATPRSHT
jgi:hypothetical protein